LGRLRTIGEILQRIHKDVTDRFGYERLLRLHADSKDFRVRLALVKHYQCRPSDHYLFVGDPAWQVRAALLERNDLEKHAYDLIKKDDHWFVEFTSKQPPHYQSENNS
jgi:hypothetical protein